MRFICKGGKVIDRFYDTLIHFYFSSEMTACFGIMCYFLMYGKVIDENCF